MQSTSHALTDSPPEARPRARASLWLASAALGGLAAWTVYAAQPGLNWLLFALGFAAALLALERPSWTELTSRRYQALALLVVLAGAATVTGNRSEEFLLFVGMSWLAAVSALLSAGRRPGDLGPGRLAAAGLVAPVLVARGAAGALDAGVRAAGREESAPIVRGALIALLTVAVFVALLGEADPTLAALRASVVDFVMNLTGIGRVVFFGAIATASLGYLHLATGPRAVPDAAGEGTRVARHTDLERMIILGSVAALFAAFLLLQLSYLFGNPGAKAGSGVTLAQAVHRGFVEISIVVALTAAILAIVERDSLRGGRENWVRLIAACVLVECLLLLASAYYRVVVYEQAYGYTVFRMYVRLYVGVLGIVIVLLGRELATGLDLARLCWRSAVAALAALALLGYWNYSAWIVRANVERAARTGRIDVGYLEHADVDGLPELVRSLPQLPAASAAQLADWIRSSSLPARAPGAFDGAWYEWNLRRSQAIAAYRGVSQHVP